MGYRIVLLILTFVGWVNISFGCSCIGELSVSQQMYSSDYVVRGKVINVQSFSTNDDGIIMHFNKYSIKVFKIYKGEYFAKNIKVITVKVFESIVSGDF